MEITTGYITHLLSPLRLTLNRLLLGLRQEGNLISITQELKDDLLWLQANLPAYNSTVMIKPHCPQPVKVLLSAVDHVVYLQWADYAAEATTSHMDQAGAGLLLLYDFMQEVAVRNQYTQFIIHSTLVSKLNIIATGKSRNTFHIKIMRSIANICIRNNIVMTID
jgi:hypothetical protein